MSGQGRPARRRARHILLAFAVSAALVGGTAACGGGGSAEPKDDNTPVTLRFAWWGSADRAKRTQEAVDAFTKKNPNIKVTTSFSAFNPYFEKLATETAGGNAPDVFQMDRAYLREYADRGVLAELDSSLAAKIAPAVAKSGELDGKLWAVPMGQTTFVMVYDPEAWRKAGVAEPAKGWTWKDLQANTTKLAAAGGGKVSGMTDLGWQWESFESWLLQQDKQLYTDDGKLAFSSDDLKRYLTLMDDLRKSKAATPANVTAGIDGAIENMPMTKGLSTIENSWDSTVKSYYKALNRPVGLVPYPSDTGKLGAYAKPSMYLSISKKTEHAEAAKKLVDFLINDEAAGLSMGVDRGLPANEDVRAAVAEKLTGADKAVYDYEQSLVSDLVPAPAAPPKGNSALKKYWQELNENIAFGKVTVDQAVKDFFDRADEELS
jgi:multiple sugar transport system substrate-binding protein